MKENCRIRLWSVCLIGCLLIAVAFSGCNSNALSDDVKAELRLQENQMLAIIPLIDGYISEHQASPLSFAALSDSGNMSIDTTGLLLIPGVKSPSCDKMEFSIYSAGVSDEKCRYNLIYTNSKDTRVYPEAWEILCLAKSDSRKIIELPLTAIH